MNQQVTEYQKSEPQLMSVDQIGEQIRTIQQLLRRHMKEGEHYGTIPGCGDKPTLLKAGAEKLALMFRLDIQIETEIIEMEGGHREYRCKAIAYHQTSGMRLGYGGGICTTMESKYRYRWMNTNNPVPQEYWATRDKEMLGGPQYSTRKVKTDENPKGEWMIFEKIEHEDPADYWNTCLKMSEKRAKVNACLSVTAASDIFTQDIEENPDLHSGQAQTTGTGTGKTYSQPQSKSESETVADGEVVGMIDEMKTQTGTRKTGKNKGTKWIKFYFIVGGKEYATFSKSINAMAETCKKNGMEARLKFHKGQYGLEADSLEPADDQEQKGEGEAENADGEY